MSDSKQNWVPEERGDFLCEYGKERTKNACKGVATMRDTRGRIETPEGGDQECKWLCTEHYHKTEEGKAALQ